MPTPSAHILGSRTAIAVALAGGLACFVGAAGGGTVGGTLTQLPGTAGCISFAGHGGCARESASPFRAQIVSIAFNQDGRVVTVGSLNGTLVLRRNPSSGKLTPTSGPGGCIVSPHNGPISPGCVPISGVYFAGPATALGPEGRTAYAGATVGIGFYVSPAVVSFERDPQTGQLTQTADPPGCFQTTVTHKCFAAKNLGASTPIVSRDGKNLYVRVRSAVWTLARDPATGALTQLPDDIGCVRDPAFIPNRRNGCALGRGLQGFVRDTVGVVESPDGRNIYTTSFNKDGGIAIFRRDPDNGSLQQLPGTAGCIVSSGLHGTCARARGIYDTVSSSISPDGRNLYVVSSELAPTAPPTSNALAVFRRNPQTGALTQLPSGAGCLSSSGLLGCSKGAGLFGVVAVTVSPDGQYVYTASFYDNAIAVFHRNPQTGALTQLPDTRGCLTAGLSRVHGTCGKTRYALGESIAVSPDSQNIYAGAVESEPGGGLLAAFKRQP